MLVFLNNLDKKNSLKNIYLVVNSMISFKLERNISYILFFYVDNYFYNY